MIRKVVPSCDVFNWPEFRALATRLGIDLDQHIRTLTLTLDMEIPARVDIQTDVTEVVY